MNWDSVARRYVEHDTTAQETFGPYFAGLDIGAPEGDKTGYWSPPAGAAIPSSPRGYNDNRIGQTVHNPAAASISGLSPQRPPRPGSFMQTFSGRKFWPLDPRAEEVHIEDIAHALSMQCRYGGHCTRFYSVAEHSVLMARTFANRDLALWALLHDAAEAYVADVPRPLKRFLPGYKEAENKVMTAICDRFGLPHEMPERVKYADECILADEIRQAMVKMAWHGEHATPLGVTLQFWDPERACEEFLLEFWNLSDRMDRRGVA